MRILRNFLLAVWLVPAAAAAQGAPADDLGDEGPEGYFYAGLAALVELPTQIQGSAYQLGGGGEFSCGYAFDDFWAFQLQVDSLYLYGLNSTSIYCLRPLAELKCSVDLGDFQAYALLGPGLNIDFIDYNNLSSATAVNFVTVAGLGVQTAVADDLELYAEGKYAVLYYARSMVPNGEITQDIPLESGLLLAL